jgi:hypothetical protein
MGFESHRKPDCSLKDKWYTADQSIYDHFVKLGLTSVKKRFDCVARCCTLYGCIAVLDGMLVQIQLEVAKGPVTAM